MTLSSFALTGVLKIDVSDGVQSENCARLKDLGYIPGKRLKLYGESFEIVSDPFIEDNCIAVHALSANDPAIRTVRLPIALLLGVEDLFPTHVS